MGILLIKVASFICLIILHQFSRARSQTDFLELAGTDKRGDETLTWFRFPRRGLNGALHAPQII